MKTYLKLLFDKQYEKADTLMQSSIPNKLYKFVSLTEDKSLNEKKLHCIEDNALFFSAIDKENDPYEFQGLYLSETDFFFFFWPVNTAKRIITTYCKEMKSLFSIACLTENDEHCLPMWAYYTNQYKGYCVEYSIINPARIHKVIYESTRSPGAQIVSNLLLAHKDGDTQEAEFARKILNIALFLKHDSWSWEREYRILDKLPKEDSPGSNIKLTEIGLSTSRIIAGINCEDKYQKRLRTICRNHSCIFNRAIISQTSFGFEEE